MCFLDRRSYTMLCGECGSVDFFQRSFEDYDPDDLLEASALQMYSIAQQNQGASPFSQELENEPPSRIGSFAAVASESADSSVDFSDVCGLDGAIRALMEAVLLPLVYPELIQRLHISPSRGVLLYGPPGTGKTMLVSFYRCSFFGSFYWTDIPIAGTGIGGDMLENEY